MAEPSITAAVAPAAPAATARARENALKKAQLFGRCKDGDTFDDCGLTLERRSQAPDASPIDIYMNGEFTRVKLNEKQEALKKAEETNRICFGTQVLRDLKRHLGEDPGKAPADLKKECADVGYELK